MTGLDLRAALYVVAVIASACAAGAAASAWRRSDVLDRALIGLVAAITSVVAPALVLGMIGLLSAVPFLLALIAIGIASVAVLLRRPESPQRVPAAWSFSGMTALAAGVALTVVSLAPTVMGLRTGHPDSRKYHIANLVAWFRNHNIWKLPFQNPGFFTATHPGNGELSSIALLFATGTDQLIYTTNMIFGALVVIACAMVARELDGRPDHAALATLAVVSTPLVFGTQAHGLATDLAACAGLIAGLACVLRARRERDPRFMLVAGCALGLALGSKYTVLFLVPIVLVGAIVAVRPRKMALWMAPGIALLAGPWFLRNLIATGNPIFPQGVTLGGVEILPGGQSPLLALKTTIATHILSGHWTIVARWLHLGWDFWGPAAFLSFAAMGAVFVRRPWRMDRLAVAGLGLLAFAIYAITPYTGAGPKGLAFLIGSNLRYTLPAALIGVTLASVALPARVLLALGGAAFAFDAMKLVQGFGFRDDLDLHTGTVVAAVVAVAVVCTTVAVIGRRTAVRLGPQLYTATAAAACLALAVGLWHVDGAVRTTRLEQVLAAEHSHDLTVIGSDDLRSLLGADLDNTLTSVSGGGRAGELPPASASQLDEELAASNSDTLVVQSGAPGVPKGWMPPPADWTYAATTSAGRVYTRTPPAPNPTTPPATPPAPPPAPTTAPAPTPLPVP